MREVRCYLDAAASAPTTNSWAGTSSGETCGRFAVLRVEVEGPIDPRTGYLCDIRGLDAVVREVVAPTLVDQGLTTTEAAASRSLTLAFQRAAARMLAPVVLESLEWNWSPFTRIQVHRKDANMVELTQSFEFAAAHRLHCADLSPEENKRLFGKCANPNGHGHNYILEVTVSTCVDHPGLTVAQLDHVVRATVLEPFDHKNLNAECPEFAELNPTVENIARVIWKRLNGVVEPAYLSRVRVWETAKTYADCTGNDPL